MAATLLRRPGGRWWKVGWCHALVLALVWCAGVGTARAAEPLVGVAQVGGVIDPINAQYLSRVLRQAEASSAQLLVIELNTPGGLSTAMETMTERLLAS